MASDREASRRGVRRAEGAEGSHLSAEERHTAAVDPGVVGGGRHALQVVLALGAADRSARQLTVVDDDLLPLHHLLHRDQRVYTTHSTIYVTYFFFFFFFVFLITRYYFISILFIIIYYLQWLSCRLFLYGYSLSATLTTLSKHYI